MFQFCNMWTIKKTYYILVLLRNLWDFTLFIMYHVYLQFLISFSARLMKLNVFSVQMSILMNFALVFLHQDINSINWISDALKVTLVLIKIE